MGENKNQVECIIGEVLEDKKAGRFVPWKLKKIRSLKVSNSFRRLGCDDRSNKLRFCGSVLSFCTNLKTGEKTLFSADFCRDRLCPMCQWRKSLKIFYQLSRVMDKVEEENIDLVPLFLTLTMKNCVGEDLSEGLDRLFNGWRQMIRYWKIKRNLKGWFRTLEITYNREKKTFHPHIHVMIFVSKDYFDKNNRDYMKTVDWVQSWRKALKVDYDPLCDIRKIKMGKKRHKAISEVAKYTLKDNDFVSDDNDLMDEIVGNLSKAMRGRRLVAFGGILKKIAKDIGEENLEQGDLICVDEKGFRKDIAVILEVYRWNFGLVNYERDFEV